MRDREAEDAVASDARFDDWCDHQSHASHQRHYRRLVEERDAARAVAESLAARVAARGELLARRAEGDATGDITDIGSPK